MCFVADDYDWIARVCETDDKVAGVDCKCDECHELIKAGDRIYMVHMHEHEECAHCRGDECTDDECPWCLGNRTDEAPCTCDEGIDIGNTFDAVWCQNCQWLREAIRDYEIKEGCSEREADPPLGRMMDELGNLGPDERWAYAAHALQLRPSLAEWIERHFGN